MISLRTLYEVIRSIVARSASLSGSIVIPTLIKSMILVVGIMAQSSLGLSQPLPEQIAGSSDVVQPLSPEVLLSLKTFVYGQRVSLSFDGRYAAYVWTNPNSARTERKTISAGPGGLFMESGAPPLESPTITIRDLKAGTEINIQEGSSTWAPSWSPNEDSLAFMSDKGGSAGLWLWSATAPIQFRKVTPTPITTAYFGTISWSPDGRAVFIADLWQSFLEVRNRGDEGTASNKNDNPEGKNARRVEVLRTGESIDRSDPALRVSSTDSQSRKLPACEAELIRVDLVSGDIQTVSHALGIDWMSPSPNGEWVAYAMMTDYEIPGRQRYQAYYNIDIVSLETRETKTLVERVPLNLRGPIGVSWSPDSKFLAFRETGMPSEQALSVVGIGGGAARVVEYLRGANRYYTPVWDLDSEHLYTWQANELHRLDRVTGTSEIVSHLTHGSVRILLTCGATNTPYRTSRGNLIVLATDETSGISAFIEVDPHSGRDTILKQEAGSIGGSYIAELCVAASAHNRVIVFTDESASQPQELWAADERFARLNRVSSLARDVWRTDLGTSRVVQWKAPNGMPTRGALLLPRNYDPQRRYPMVVWMYESVQSKLNAFGLTGQVVFNCQLLATRGIACFYPDLKWEQGHVMMGLHEQMEAAIKAMVEQGFADPDRIGIEGQSSGGYDVFAVASTTPGIAAAIACSGVVDMASAFDYHHGEWVQDQMGLEGPPWQHPEMYIANSPSFHMDRIHTPILLLQGTSDAFNLTQMDLAFELLQAAGGTAEYRRYIGEGHAPDNWSFANRLDAVNRMLNWWEHFLTPNSRVARK